MRISNQLYMSKDFLSLHKICILTYLLKINIYPLVFGFLLIDVHKKNQSCGSLNWRFGLQTQYVLKQPSETWDGKPRRILPTLRVSPTYVFLHRTLAIEPTHSIRHRRTCGRVIYAESASDLTTHKLKFTHQPGSYAGHQKFTKSFRYQMFWDWRIWFGHCQRLSLNGNKHPCFEGFISI